MAVLLTCDAIGKSFGSRTVFSDISLSQHDGERRGEQYCHREPRDTAAGVERLRQVDETRGEVREDGLETRAADEGGVGATESLGRRLAEGAVGPRAITALLPHEGRQEGADQ